MTIIGYARQSPPSACSGFTLTTCSPPSPIRTLPLWEHIHMQGGKVWAFSEVQCVFRWGYVLFKELNSHGQRSLAGYSPWSHRVRHDWAHTWWNRNHSGSKTQEGAPLRSNKGSSLFSYTCSQPEQVYHCSIPISEADDHTLYFVTPNIQEMVPWIVLQNRHSLKRAHQAPLSMEFSRQEYWSGLPCPPPGDLPNPGIKPASLASSALAGRSFTTVPPGKP